VIGEAQLDDFSPYPARGRQPTETRRP